MVYQRPVGKHLAGRFFRREVARKLNDRVDRKSKEGFLPPVAMTGGARQPATKNIVTPDNARAF